MALSVKAAQADELARRLAQLTGESLTGAITTALRERLAREPARRASAADLPARLTALASRVRRLQHAAGQPGGAGRGFRRRGMIVIDSSAVVAILFGEPVAQALLARLALDPDRAMSTASSLETGTVLAGRRHSEWLRAIDDLDCCLDEAAITLVPVDGPQARLAPQARIRFGRGMGHGGVLNFGDAFSCALAGTTGPAAVHWRRLRHDRRHSGAVILALGTAA